MTSISHSSKKTSGAALMAVLWLIAILGMACMAALRVISFDMEIASAKVHGSRARQIAEMGIAVGSNYMVKKTDPLLHRVNAETNESFDVKIISEGGRFNINWILIHDDKPLLREIFTKWGLELEDAQKVVDALADWIDQDDNVALNGAEKDFYEKEGRINQPFNRPFYNLGEMSLVRGMDLVEAVRPDWREWFTIYSTGGLDVNEASAEMIAIAAEVQVEQADTIPEKVRGPDGERDTTDDFNYQDASAALAEIGVDTQNRPDIIGRFAASDSVHRIESIGIAEGAKHKITVIVRNRSSRPILLERIEETIP